MSRRLSSLIIRSLSQESTNYPSTVPNTPSEISLHFITEGTTPEKDFPKTSDPKRGEACEGRSRSNSKRVSPLDEKSASPGQAGLSSKTKMNATPPYLPCSGSRRKIVWLLGEEVMQNQQRAWS